MLVLGTPDEILIVRNVGGGEMIASQSKFYLFI